MRTLQLKRVKRKAFYTISASIDFFWLILGVLYQHTCQPSGLLTCSQPTVNPFSAVAGGLDSNQRPSDYEPDKLPLLYPTYDVPPPGIEPGSYD